MILACFGCGRQVRVSASTGRISWHRCDRRRAGSLTRPQKKRWCQKSTTVHESWRPPDVKPKPKSRRRAV